MYTVNSEIFVCFSFNEQKWKEIIAYVYLLCAQAG